jgi:hypothetical protein
LVLADSKDRACARPGPADAVIDDLTVEMWKEPVKMMLMTGASRAGRSHRNGAVCWTVDSGGQLRAAISAIPK